MTKKPTLTSVSSGFTSQATLNDNFNALRDAFDNTLSRDGSTPNQMEADLDLNSNDILNASDVEVTGVLTVQGVDINDLLNGVGPGTVFNTTNRFSGDNSTTDFVLTKNPVSRSNTQVYIDGVYQQKDTYSVSGTTLSFTEAPPAGTSNIEVNIQESADAGTVTADSVSTSDGEDVQAKLDQAHYTSRSLFVADVAAGKTWVDGEVVSDGSVLYVKSTGTSDISDLPGWLPFGEATPKHWGAVGDGVADDTAAITSALSYSDAISLPLGDFKSTTDQTPGHTGLGRIVTKGLPSGNRGGNFTPQTNNHKIDIVGNFPQRFDDYTSVLSTYSYNFVYPQSFVVDETVGEIWIAYQSDGGSNSWAWVTVYDFASGTEKVTFSAGSGDPEAIAVVYEGSTRYLYIKEATDTIGRYDVTTLPSNLSRETAANTYNVSMRNSLAERGGNLYVETVTRGTGSFKTSYSRFSLPVTSVEAQFTFDQFQLGTTSNYGSDGTLRKRQGFSAGDGFFAGAFGGLYTTGTATRLHDYGVATWNANGDIIQSSYITGDGMLQVMTDQGLSPVRVENEGCWVSSDNKIYSACVIYDSTSGTAADNGGIIIIQHFSDHPDAIDISQYVAPEIPSNDRYVWRPFRTGIPSGDMHNPLTGDTINTLADIFDYLRFLNIGRAEFYTTSFPNVDDFAGGSLPSSTYVEVINFNNSSCIALLHRNGYVRVLQWNGSSQSDWSNRVAPSDGTNDYVLDLVGAGDPNGVYSAPVGSTYRRTDGGAGTSFYVKESGTGNTGWVAK